MENTWKFEIFCQGKVEHTLGVVGSTYARLLEMYSGTVKKLQKLG